MATSFWSGALHPRVCDRRKAKVAQSHKSSTRTFPCTTSDLGGQRLCTLPYTAPSCERAPKSWCSNPSWWRKRCTSRQPFSSSEICTPDITWLQLHQRKRKEVDFCQTLYPPERKRMHERVGGHIGDTVPDVATEDAIVAKPLEGD
eukprot:4181248-Amphidinium_carterae.1